MLLITNAEIYALQLILVGQTQIGMRKIFLLSTLGFISDHASADNRVLDHRSELAHPEEKTPGLGFDSGLLKRVERSHRIDQKEFYS